jgi:hypothetical protein
MKLAQGRFYYFSHLEGFGGNAVYFEFGLGFYAANQR